MCFSSIPPILVTISRERNRKLWVELEGGLGEAYMAIAENRVKWSQSSNAILNTCNINNH